MLVFGEWVIIAEDTCSDAPSGDDLQLGSYNNVDPDLVWFSRGLVFQGRWFQTLTSGEGMCQVLAKVPGMSPHHRKCSGKISSSPSSNSLGWI